MVQQHCIGAPSQWKSMFKPQHSLTESSINQTSAQGPTTNDMIDRSHLRCDVIKYMKYNATAYMLQWNYTSYILIQVTYFQSLHAYILTFIDASCGYSNLKLDKSSYLTTYTSLWYICIGKITLQHCPSRRHVLKKNR